MKTYLKIITTLLMLSCLKMEAQAQDTAKYPQTVVIRTLESVGIGKGIDSKMVIVNPNNEIQTINLEHLNTLDILEGVEHNTKTLHLELQKWHNQGFEVKSSTVLTLSQLIITTVILQKN